MKSQISIAITSIDRDPEQPRKQFDEAELLALGENLRQYGQQVPLIVYRHGERFVLLDGERRFRAATLVSLKELNAIVLPERPSLAQLHVLRMSIDIHKVAHSTVERSDLLARIQAETKWSITEIATHLSLTQPTVSKLLAFQRLCPEVRELLHRGQLDMEKAFICSSEADPAKQAALATQAADMSREQLRNLKRPASAHATTPKAGDAPKASNARFVMPGGMTVCVQGNDLELGSVVEVLSEAVRVLKHGLARNRSIATQMRVMRDEAKQLPKSAATP